MVAGLLVRGTGRGLLAGFLFGIAGAILLAILVSSGIGIFGTLLHIPVIVSIIGGAVGVVILLTSLYNGFLGLIGGAIGGSIRKK